MNTTKAELSDLDRGYSVYTRRSLSLYDWWVLGLSNRFVWKCPTEKLIEHYQAHLTPNHLEVGAGTGYFLEKTLPTLDEEHPRVVLFDANGDCLDYAVQRLEAHRPEVHQDNVLEPFDLEGEPFDSIAVNYLFHCLPGKFSTKAELALDHLLPSLKDDGILFGSTILGAEIRRPLLSIPIMNVYNQKGIFSNREDSLGSVMEALSKRFKSFHVTVEGCVCIFSGRGVRDSYRESLAAITASAPEK